MAMSENATGQQVDSQLEGRETVGSTTFTDSWLAECAASKPALADDRKVINLFLDDFGDSKTIHELGFPFWTNKKSH
jgi:hypothetical protein